MKGDFHASYTAANVSKDAAPYNFTFFNSLKQKLDEADQGYLGSFSYALMSVMFCAQRRGDLVGPWFRDLVKKENSGGDPRDPKETFTVIREAIAVAYPFIGLPNCVPACFGLIGVLNELGIEITDLRRRKPVSHEDYLAKGLETRQKIYRGVGNPEVHWMLQKYFPDMTYATDTFIFGYLAAGSLDVFELKQTELIIAASILAMGATRQSRSHCKASMQLGNSEAVVSSLVDTARQIGLWNGQLLSDDIVVSSLAEELKSNLVKEEGYKE